MTLEPDLQDAQAPRLGREPGKAEAGGPSCPALGDATAPYGRPRLLAQTYRAQNKDATPPGFSSRSPQSPAAGSRRLSRTPDRLPSRSSQSRAAMGRQRISGPHSRHDESNSDRGIGLPAETGCFAADRARRGARPFHPDSARAPARQPAAAVSAAACLRGVAPMHGRQRGPR